MNKFSFVLVGLVVSFSLMISVAAYFSANPTAYVSAETILSIDFGNVFPGTTPTEYFIIGSVDGQTYNYTLTSSPAVVKDMSPYLEVWKDPAEAPETEPDGSIDGRIPDLTAEGSFTNPDDLSDKWFVTFHVPGVTLPKDVGYDYGCQISIEPLVVFESGPVVEIPTVPAGDLVLWPDADGDLTQFDYPAEVSHWNLVGDIGIHDGDVTYVYSIANGGFEMDLYNIWDSGLTPGTTIYKVTLVAAIKGNGTTMTNGFFVMKTGGTAGVPGSPACLPAMRTTHGDILRIQRQV